jgi:molecular chaperone GrpE
VSHGSDRAEDGDPAQEQVAQAEDAEASGVDRAKDAEATGVDRAEDEPSVGTLEPNEELEAAMREATDSVSAIRAQRQADTKADLSPATSTDKLTIEILSEELQSLKCAYEAGQSEFGELKDRYVRLQAEFENFRRRGLKERQETLRYGHQNLVKDLLSTVDNLERALQHAEQSGGEKGLEGLLQGVDLVLRDLLGVLGKHGVTVIEAESQLFDPALHEAMAQIDNPDVPPNTVVQVIEKGYMLSSRMMRPARVLVSKPPEGEEPAEAELNEDAADPGAEEGAEGGGEE